MKSCSAVSKAVTLMKGRALEDVIYYAVYYINRTSARPVTKGRGWFWNPVTNIRRQKDSVSQKDRNPLKIWLDGLQCSRHSTDLLIHYPCV